MMNLKPAKTPLRILALVSTVVMLAACGSDKSSGGSTPALSDDTPEVLSYVGTETCLTCHEEKETFLETGHNFKVTKVVDGQVPERPFTDLEGSLEILEGVENAAGHPEGWEDIGYVIGGYRRAIMFVDKEGFVLTGKTTIVNLPEEGQPYTPDLGWSLPHYDGGGPDLQPFDYCGRCHTTGWKDYTSAEEDNRNKNRQDNLRGMGGTFDQAGIQCEACHGAGSEHVKSPSSTNITRVATGRKTSDFLADDMAYGKAVACAECHSKDGERLYPTYTSHYNEDFGGDSLGGRIKEYPFGSRLAADGLLGMDPDTGVAMGKKKDFQCSTCHDVHMSMTNRDKPGHENAQVKECTDCHGDMEFANAEGGGGSAGHEFVAKCTDCHMPSEYHVFKIDISSPSDSPEHFSEDGKYMQPWLTAERSCGGCHDDYDERAAKIKKVHL